MNPRQPVFGGGLADAFVSKLNPSGSALVFSTYLGGGTIDGAAGIALDPGGNVHVTGVQLDQLSDVECRSERL